jgi:hypothetical protein
VKIRLKLVGKPLAVAPPQPYTPSSYSTGPYSVGPYSQGAGAPSAGSGWILSPLCPAVTWRQTQLPAFIVPAPNPQRRMSIHFRKAA